MNRQSNPATDSNLSSTGQPEDPLDIVTDIERRWAHYVRADPYSMAAELYDDCAIFFGSKAEMFVGQSGVARYFRGVAPGFVLDAIFSDRAVKKITEDVIIYGGYVAFRLSRPEGPIDVLFRITLTLVKRTEGWKIVQHHASPRPDG